MNITPRETLPSLFGVSLCVSCKAARVAYIVCLSIFVTVSEKTDHLAPMQFVQYGPKALQRSRSKDFTISMPRCSKASLLALTQVSAFS